MLGTDQQVQVLTDPVDGVDGVTHRIRSLDLHRAASVGSAALSENLRTILHIEGNGLDIDVTGRADGSRILIVRNPRADIDVAGKQDLAILEDDVPTLDTQIAAQKQQIGLDIDVVVIRGA